MRILGLVFAGTSTPHRSQMTGFLADALQMSRVQVDGVEADLFELPDGSTFAVASPGGMGETTRTLGFLVDDLEAVAAVLREAGVAVDGSISENERERYLHFRAPDGELYELVERKGEAS
jgi:catechol 2,3-dioxygenase-like lactoylglutathione lyase family enzyme